MAKPEPAIDVAKLFPSLDFPGRTNLYVHEVAKRIGCSQQHILDLIDEGQIDALDLAGIGSSTGNRRQRRTLRIPREAWLRFLAKRLHPAHSRN